MITGHSAVVSIPELKEYSEFIRDLVRTVQEAKKAGRTAGRRGQDLEGAGALQGVHPAAARLASRGRAGDLGRDEIEAALLARSPASAGPCSHCVVFVSIGTTTSSCAIPICEAGLPRRRHIVIPPHPHSSRWFTAEGMVRSSRQSRPADVRPPSKQVHHARNMAAYRSYLRELVAAKVNARGR